MWLILTTFLFIKFGTFNSIVYCLVAQISNFPLCFCINMKMWQYPLAKNHIFHYLIRVLCLKCSNLIKSCHIDCKKTPRKMDNWTKIA